MRTLWSVFLVAVVAGILVALIYDNVIVPMAKEGLNTYVLERSAHVSINEYIPEIELPIYEVREECASCVDSSILDRFGRVLAYGASDPDLVVYEVSGQCLHPNECEGPSNGGLYWSKLEPSRKRAALIDTKRTCTERTILMLQLTLCESRQLVGGKVAMLVWNGFLQRVPFDPFPKSFQFDGALPLPTIAVSRITGECDGDEFIRNSLSSDFSKWCQR